MRCFAALLVALISLAHLARVKRSRLPATAVSATPEATLASQHPELGNNAWRLGLGPQLGSRRHLAKSHHATSSWEPQPSKSRWHDLFKLPSGKNKMDLPMQAAPEPTLAPKAVPGKKDQWQRKAKGAASVVLGGTLLGIAAVNPIAGAQGLAFAGLLAVSDKLEKVNMKRATEISNKTVATHHEFHQAAQSSGTAPKKDSSAWKAKAGAASVLLSHGAIAALNPIAAATFAGVLAVTAHQEQQRDKKEREQADKVYTAGELENDTGGWKKSDQIDHATSGALQSEGIARVKEAIQELQTVEAVGM